ncbi:MAG: ABC transporter permease [Gammaproteobacteria bacterium]|nr:ABC transporter permease [Gammaproteobacteria bacterium]
MGSFRVLLAKETKALFISPIAAVVITVFILLMGYTFTSWLFVSQSASLVRVMYQAAVLLLVFVPVITMRAFAEERRHGTLELLLSTPAAEFAIVAAKFGACMAVILTMLSLTLVYPAVLQYFSEPDWGPVYSGYLGLSLLAAALVALGLWLSALTSNQIVAAIGSMGLFLLLWVGDSLGNLLPDPFDVLAVNASLIAHFTPFSVGALYLSDFGYFVTVILLGLFACVRALARP